MVSDKPPRRSRSGKTPVTIDLAAEDKNVEEKGVIAEPVRADDTDAATPAISNEASGDHAPAKAAAAEGLLTDSKPAQSAPASGEATDAEPAKIGEEAQATSIETKAAAELPPKPDHAQESSASPFGQETAEKPVQPATPVVEENLASGKTEPRAKQSPSTSAMIAAGIAGGLVALLLAGSMQYAGIIPGLGPQGRGDTAAIDQLRQQVAALQNAKPPADLSARIAALEKNGGGNTQLVQQVETLQRDLAAAKSANAAMGDNSAKLGQRMQALEQRINQPGREQAIARALAAAGLKAATDRGGSFKAELDTFASVAADDPAASKLQAYADKGVPTRADLVRRFPAAANAMIDAIHQPAAEEGIAARLMSSAMRVVKVRPVGDVDGDTPEARVARMEERIKNGDLKAAAAEFIGLPDAAKQAASAYKQALDARIDVDELAAGTLTRAMAASGSNG
ncbi:hypothetical protein [Rhizobium sp. FKY42]|uniref:COG4223 family protein n=1 Tax=Rhizobium sp. FKY42 TaxID=2562310 RepID=UPI0010C11B87|nr:hypothetical protein [Rhizobium sp. FKY42]